MTKTLFEVAQPKRNKKLYTLSGINLFKIFTFAIFFCTWGCYRSGNLAMKLVTILLKKIANLQILNKGSRLKEDILLNIEYFL